MDTQTVADAFTLLRAFLDEGSASVDGESVAKLGAAIKTVDEWSKALKRCLDGAHCPAKVTMQETPSGLMVDADTPGPTLIEFKSEHQAP
jgi:hypothetical protein